MERRVLTRSVFLISEDDRKRKLSGRTMYGAVKNRVRGKGYPLIFLLRKNLGKKINHLIKKNITYLLGDYSKVYTPTSEYQMPKKGH